MSVNSLMQPTVVGKEYIPFSFFLLNFAIIRSYKKFMLQEKNICHQGFRGIFKTFSREFEEYCQISRLHYGNVFFFRIKKRDFFSYVKFLYMYKTQNYDYWVIMTQKAFRDTTSLTPNPPQKS